MKVYIICYITGQILYVEKIWFLRYRPTALGQLDCSIFKPNISLEQNNEIP